ncbi:MAG: L,D-transpeptidase [Thermoleophilia bacterium]|nr:L,D-transpeptidase [Thermoleophilia bacterium]
MRRTMLTAVGALALLLPAAAQATPTITSVTPAKVTIGDAATISGTVDSLAAGEHVQLQQQIAGTWTQVGIASVTTAGGAWKVGFKPRSGGALKAVQTTGTFGESAPTSIAVAPKVLSARLVGGTVYPFLGTTAVWKVAPATYPNAKVRVNISIDGRAAGWTTGRIRGGTATVNVPTNGTGRFTFQLVLPKQAAFAQVGDKRLKFNVRTNSVGSGSSSMWVRSLRAGLQFRGFYTTSSGGFDARMGESVIAFHKAYGLSRSSSFNASDWTVLTKRAVAVSYPRAGAHIEIDKGRQILMQVKNGKPWMIIHVSTGRTGNTPAGTHKILWKGEWVPSFYETLLYKSMAFQGGFAIHGYPSVPTTPASHGCVRVPMWIAPRLYSVSPVGEAVYVYERGSGATVSVGRSGAADTPELTGADPATYGDEFP